MVARVRDQLLTPVARTLKGADKTKGKIDEFILLLADPKLFQRLTYMGFPCPRGHVVRHHHHHWCVQCMADVLKNHCGMTLNDVEISHSSFYPQFFECVVPPKRFDECWSMREEFLALKDRNYPRLTALTYRTGLAGVSHTISLTKFVYNFFWGDAGALVVTKTCKNAACWNPLHMKCCFNIQPPPKRVDPLSLAFDPVVNMQKHAAQATRKPSPQPYLDPDLIRIINGI